jgi:hypothetical protein
MQEGSDEIITGMGYTAVRRNEASLWVLMEVSKLGYVEAVRYGTSIGS